MTYEQSASADKLRRAARESRADANTMAAGDVFFEDAPNNRNYGIAPHVDMPMDIVVMVSPTHAVTVGKARIAPDGTIRVPQTIKRRLPTAVLAVVAA